jgi:hypothetical protein
MILAGLWFGLVVSFGVWTWGVRSLTAAAAALAATWIAWEVAVNLALQLEGNWLKDGMLPEAARSYASGFAAGGVGALLVWAGAALVTPALQRLSTAALVVATGAVLGLLMPWTNGGSAAAVAGRRRGGSWVWSGAGAFLAPAPAAFRPRKRERSGSVIGQRLAPTYLDFELGLSLTAAGLSLNRPEFESRAKRRPARSSRPPVNAT